MNLRFWTIFNCTITFCQLYCTTMHLIFLNNIIVEVIFRFTWALITWGYYSFNNIYKNVYNLWYCIVLIKGCSKLHSCKFPPFFCFIFIVSLCKRKQKWNGRFLVSFDGNIIFCNVSFASSLVLSSFTMECGIRSSRKVSATYLATVYIFSYFVCFFNNSF